MSKVLVIPDAHLNRNIIRTGLKLADKHHADYVVMMGDYFDHWYAPDTDMDKMIKYLKSILNKPNLIALLGNHEFGYMGFRCSGNRNRYKKELGEWFRQDNRFLVCAEIDKVLYSHAGVTNRWLIENKIVTANDIRYRITKNAGARLLERAINGAPSWTYFDRVGSARGGKDAPSPLWTDLRELAEDHVGNLRQVVGHTPLRRIECVGPCWCVDIFSNDIPPRSEYLLVSDGEPKILIAEEEL